MKTIAVGLIKLYQNTLSRVLPPSCRFQPTCSHYGVEAIEKYGFTNHNKGIVGISGLDLYDGSLA